MEAKRKWTIEIIVGILSFILFAYFMQRFLVKDYIFISFMIFTVSDTCLILDFRSKYLTAFVVTMMPTAFLNTIGIQISIIQNSILYNWTLAFTIEDSLSNFWIHGFPFLVGYFVIKTNKTELVNWNLYRNIYIGFLLYCYFIDWRFTDVDWIFRFKWFIFGIMSWNTGFTYFFIRERNKTILRNQTKDELLVYSKSE